jgi:hypothetical protein
MKDKLLDYYRVRTTYADVMELATANEYLVAPQL